MPLSSPPMKKYIKFMPPSSAINPSAPKCCGPARPIHIRRQRAMTLVEVMIAMAIISFFSLSAFSLTLLNEKRTSANFYRLEAYRLAQTIAEHAMEVTYPGNFTTTYLMGTNDPTSATQYQWTGTERAMLKSSALGTSATQFTYPSAGSGVVFTKTITNGSPIGTALVLNINISWNYAGRAYSISIPVVRGGN